MGRTFRKKSIRRKKKVNLKQHCRLTGHNIASENSIIYSFLKCTRSILYRYQTLGPEKSNTYKKIEIITNIFSNYKGVKSEVNKKRKTRKCKHVGEKKRVKDQDKMENRKYTEINKHGSAMYSRSSSKREFQRGKHLHLKNIYIKQTI